MIRAGEKMMAENDNEEIKSFYGLGISPRLLETLEELKFTVPTPIQYKAIPIALEGQDVVGIAQTGTGKTLAFGIPLVQRLVQQEGLGLILVPTRELAIQVNETMEKIQAPFALGTCVLIGGAPFDRQLRSLRKKPRVLVATPGRLIDHLQQKTIDLHTVHSLVLDEADRMFDMGFAPQINRIMRSIPKKGRQTMLFSATMPSGIVSLARGQMQLPLHIEIARAGTAAENISQEVFIIKQDMKEKLLHRLLDQYHGTVLIFTRTKIAAQRIARLVQAWKYRAAEIHSNLRQSQRKDAMEGFKSGKYRILIATDIAARGIDVTGIELVLNYDVPDEAENYVHRIGRTGRIGNKGHAITLATPDQEKEIRSIEKLIQTAIPIAEHPEIPMENFIEVAPRRMSFGGRVRTSQGAGKGRGRTKVMRRRL